MELLNLQQGKMLIELARKAIEYSFEKKSLELEEYEKEFSQERGVFVTLKKDGELRGCIGFPEPIFPLFKAIVKAAKAAAFEDPRFPPVQKTELPDIEIDVSVLTLPKLIKIENPEECAEKIDIGIDGLMIKIGTVSGLLLPQVAPEHDMDEMQFLQETCKKAELPPDAWKNPNVEIYKFQAQIFTEEEGEVMEKDLL
ncbi:TIGR00296 family protein [Candidatus Woesearchaeota archaeon]|nr:TIGR00296 family protein [Candidatus Woesearchaeota archaeon]